MPCGLIASRVGGRGTGWDRVPRGDPLFVAVAGTREGARAGWWHPGLLPLPFLKEPYFPDPLAQILALPQCSRIRDSLGVRGPLFRLEGSGKSAGRRLGDAGSCKRSASSVKILRHTEVRGGVDSAPHLLGVSSGQRPTFCVCGLALGRGQPCWGHTCRLQQVFSGLGGGWRLCPGRGSQVGMLTPPGRVSAAAGGQGYSRVQGV